jgi:pyridoxine 4-dehydrogenase
MALRVGPARRPILASALSLVAEELGATVMSVALAWLLQPSPNMLLIPGTSSVDHLRENVAGAGPELPTEAVRRLDAISGP